MISFLCATFGRKTRADETKSKRKKKRILEAVVTNR